DDVTVTVVGGTDILITDPSGRGIAADDTALITLDVRPQITEVVFIDPEKVIEEGDEISLTVTVGETSTTFSGVAGDGDDFDALLEDLAENFTGDFAAVY